MFGLGIGELLVILLIVILLFSRRLPEVGESLGKGIRKFRKSMQSADEIDVTPKEKEDKENRDP